MQHDVEGDSSNILGVSMFSQGTEHGDTKNICRPLVYSWTSSKKQQILGISNAIVPSEFIKTNSSPSHSGRIVAGDRNHFLNSRVMSDSSAMHEKPSLLFASQPEKRF